MLWDPVGAISAAFHGAHNLSINLVPITQSNYGAYNAELFWFPQCSIKMVPITQHDLEPIAQN